MESSEKIIERIDTLIKRGEDIMQNLTPSPYGGYYISRSDFWMWKPSCDAFLESVFGDSHIFSTTFKRKCDRADYDMAETGVSILRASKDEIENGFLIPIKELVQADIFTNFLDMAEHLLKNNYKDPAAMLIGAVLESELKNFAVKKGITIKPEDDLSSVNTKIAQASLYSNAVRQAIQSNITLRNYSAHGEFEKYRIEEVYKMLENVREFIIRYLT